MAIPEDTVRLVAGGRAGGWSANISQPEERGLLMLQIDGPRLYLEVEVSSAAVIEQCARFLKGYSGSNTSKEMRLGSFSGLDVVLRKDDELADRFFLVISASSSMLVTLRGEDVQALAQAIDRALTEIAF